MLRFSYFLLPLVLSGCNETTMAFVNNEINEKYGSGAQRSTSAYSTSPTSNNRGTTSGRDYFAELIAESENGSQGPATSTAPSGSHPPRNCYEHVQQNFNLDCDRFRDPNAPVGGTAVSR